MSISKSLKFQDYQNISNIAAYLFLAFCITLLTLFPETCFAGTGGAAQFKNMSDTISGYVNGTPAVALLVSGLFYAVYLMVFKHNVIPVVFVFLAAVIASTGSTVITGLVSALI